MAIVAAGAAAGFAVSAALAGLTEGLVLFHPDPGQDHIPPEDGMAPSAEEMMAAAAKFAPLLKR